MARSGQPIQRKASAGGNLATTQGTVVLPGWTSLVMDMSDKLPKKGLKLSQVSI